MQEVELQFFKTKLNFSKSWRRHFRIKKAERRGNEQSMPVINYMLVENEVP